MGRFDSIYPFTTENIAGYMKILDLTNKKIITVTGSADHIINAILKGCKDITTFDINPLTKYYMDLKLSAIKYLSYEEFLNFLLYDTNDSFNINILNKLNLPNYSKKFWLEELEKNKNDGLLLKKSGLFNLKYFYPEDKIKYNLYLNKENYDIIKKNLEYVKIEFINSSVTNLDISEKYDYMFLSNISDYLNMFYENNELENYKKLIFNFLKNVKHIYFAYLYDIDGYKKRSYIDNINKVKEIFGKIEIHKFSSALHNSNVKDGVLIKEGGN